MTMNADHDRRGVRRPRPSIAAGALPGREGGHQACLPHSRAGQGDPAKACLALGHPARGCGNFSRVWPLAGVGCFNPRRLECRRAGRLGGGIHSVRSIDRSLAGPAPAWSLLRSPRPSIAAGGRNRKPPLNVTGRENFRSLRQFHTLLTLQCEYAFYRRLLLRVSAYQHESRTRISIGSVSLPLGGGSRGRRRPPNRADQDGRCVAGGCREVGDQ